IQALELAADRADEHPGSTERAVVGVCFERLDRARGEVELFLQSLRRAVESKVRQLDTRAQLEARVVRRRRERDGLGEDRLGAVGIPALANGQAELAQELAAGRIVRWEEPDCALEQIRGRRHVRALPCAEARASEPVARGLRESACALVDAGHLEPIKVRLL